MQLERIESEGLAHYSYLLSDAGQAVVVDPRRDVDAYLERTSLAGLRLLHVLETHRNEDYLVGSARLGELTGAEVWHADSQLDYGYGSAVSDGQRWRVGGLEIEALETPGHTEGHMAYLVRTPEGEPWLLFSGDLLFAGDVGRTDLLGEDRAAEMAGLLYDSLHERVLPLGDHVMLLPAHGPGSACGGAIADRPWTTLGLERRLNPLLGIDNRGAFVARAGQSLEYPPYFRQMEARNLTGEAGFAAPPPPTPLAPAELYRRRPEGTVLDTRMVPGFGAAHVPGSLSIWHGGLGSFAGWFLSADQPVFLVGEEDDPGPAIRTLARMGFDHVAGYLAGGMHAWHVAGYDSASIPVLSVPEIGRRLDAQPGLYILDVRSEAELEGGRIPDAHHIHITQLPGRIGDVPRDRPVTVFCGSGLRSMIGASLLEGAGYEGVSVVMGGVEGWKSEHFPLQ